MGVETWIYPNLDEVESFWFTPTSQELDSPLKISWSASISGKTLRANDFFEEIGTNRAVIDPVYALFTSCLKAPSIKNGVFASSGVAITDPIWPDLGQSSYLDVGTKYDSEFEKLLLGCPSPKQSLSSKWVENMCIFSLGGSKS